MPKLIIWGATGQAIVLEELLSYTGIAIAAFFENNPSVVSPVASVPVFYGQQGFKKWMDDTPDFKEYYYLVAIGGSNSLARQEMSQALKAAGLKPYTAIHPTAFVAKNALIGEAAQILAQSSICARVLLGDNCIVNTAASIDHECVIGNNVHIGPGARLAGSVLVSDNVFIGANATILPRIEVGKNVIIGAGAVVTQNVKENSVVVGNPARAINKNQRL